MSIAERETGLEIEDEEEEEASAAEEQDNLPLILATDGQAKKGPGA